MNQISIHLSLNKLFSKVILSDQEIKEILALEPKTLSEDLQKIIKFCNKNKCELDNLDENISYNLPVYALFLLKEIDAELDFQFLVDILYWKEYVREFWFSDMFAEYYWQIFYHYGQKHLVQMKEILKKTDIDVYNKEQVALSLNQIYLKNENLRLMISESWTELLQFYNQSSKKNSESTFLGFFNLYIAEPNEEQKSLIKALHDKNYVDENIYGEYEDLREDTVAEEELCSIWGLNEKFKTWEKLGQSNNSPEIDVDFLKNSGFIALNNLF